MSTGIEADSEAAFSRGIHGVWERRVELRKMFMAKARVVAEQFGEELKTLGEHEANRLNDERFDELEEPHWVRPEPLWQQISGLRAGSHVRMSPNERAGRIRLFLRRVERMIRVEMGSFVSRRDAGTDGMGSRKDAEAQRTEEEADRHPGRQECLPHPEECLANSIDGERSLIERTVFWSPVREICVYLEISQRALSSLCREITGVGIQEIVDRIKAEGLRGSLKERLKGVVMRWFGEKGKDKDTCGRDACGTGRQDACGTIAEEIFAGLKAERRGKFHRTQWAMELGFSSYSRMFRAALLAEGMTPHQMEMAVIEGLIPSEEEDAVCVGGRNEIVEVSGGLPTAGATLAAARGAASGTAAT